MRETPWQVAETIAESHLNDLGFFRVQRTASGADGGLDVIGQGVAAQVKLLRTPVGSPDIQRLRGAAHRVDNAVFYAHQVSGYSRAAARVANEAEVALFTYDLDGTVAAANHHASEIESPLFSTQRALAQAGVVQVRVAAVRNIVRDSTAGISERLKEIMLQLETIIAELPDGATIDDLPLNVTSLQEEGKALAGRFNGRPPVDELDAIGKALEAIDTAIDRLQDGNLVDLLHTPWRSEFVESVKAAHEQLEPLTESTIAWLGQGSVEGLRDAAVQAIGVLGSRITAEEALEGWPILPGR